MISQVPRQVLTSDEVFLQHRRQRGSFLPLIMITFMLALASISVVQVAEAFSSPTYHTTKALATSIEICNALMSSHPSDESVKLNLETDFYDPTTGLFSEGVWHNALLGIASLEQQQQTRQQATDNVHIYTAATTLQLADSLYRHSWDGISFRRRCWSGNWDHSTLDNIMNNKPPEQANYYRESSEHRCVQHGMALVFWSKLVQANMDPTGSDAIKLQKQQTEIAQQFITEFWDSKALRWNTVSQTQGGGTKERPSASAGRPAQNINDHQVKQPYYRAVDQAVAVLACYEHLQCIRAAAATMTRDETLV